MIDFIQSQFVFYLALILLLFLPGYFLLYSTKLNKRFSSLEQFVLAFTSSIGVVDFLIIILGKSQFQITRLSVVISVLVFLLICSGFYYFGKNHHSELQNEEIVSKKYAILAVLLIFLTIFINTIYFKDTIYPTATDLGHHMYWAKTIVDTGHLPKYEKVDISSDLTLSKPQPIADFIIGEHLIFAAIALISGADFLSSFPIIVLFLVHLISLLAIFILTKEVFKNCEHTELISLLTLLFVGPLYALASPQAKFASGGVIGNTIGNLFIPVLIFLFIKAFEEKKSSLLSLALFISIATAYTHHLSTFVFIFISLFTFVIFAIINYKTLAQDLKDLAKLALKPSVIAVLSFAAICIFILYMPTYLNTKAIDTAVGTPSKSTRTGLTFSQLRSTAGEARFAFAIIGLILLYFFRKIGKYKQSFIIGWLLSLILMSLKPDLLFIDIPSDRIASYIVFPMAIVASFMFVNIMFLIKKDIKNKTYVRSTFVLSLFLFFISFVVSDGFKDDANSLNLDSSANSAIQTFAASQYLASKTTPEDIILKDHNYLSGDSWIKLAFMRGYNYPLSRGYFKRYQDQTKMREQCTNFMITSPNGLDAQKCFNATGTDYIMINPRMDSTQFQKSNDFSQVYSSNEVTIFYKKNN